MDYNGSSKTGTDDNAQPFFTPGIGNASANPEPSVDDINTNHDTWGGNNVDPSKIGQTAIYSPNTPITEGLTPEATDQALSSEANPTVATTTDISMPPGYEAEAKVESIEQEPPVDRHIALVGDRITGRVLSEIKTSEVELAQTGDAAKFYDEIRGSIVSEDKGGK